MRDGSNVRHRRAFLKLGVSGLVLAGSGLVVSARAAGLQKTIILRTSTLEVELDAATGLPVGYRLPASGIRFAGSVTPLSVRVFRQAPRGFAMATLGPVRAKASARTADFVFTALYNGQAAAEFTLRYALDGGTVRVTLEAVREHAGYELISIAMPSLVSVEDGQPDAWLAHADGGGNVVALKDAKPGSLKPNRFWGEINGILPVTMTGHSGAVCVQETTAFMDGTLLSVTEDGGKRRALMGTTKVYRVDGGACYDMNLGSDVPGNCGVATTPNLIVGQQSACRLDFLEPKDVALTWLDGARRVRNRMPPSPTKLYDDKYVYGLMVDQPSYAQPAATFDHCGEIIRDLHALTDGAPQIVHLWGWQYRGKDTGYPAVDVVDARAGGYDGMMRLMDGARASNATVSLSDNYDDAYRSSPAWNEDMIARRPDGELWKSRAWTGEESYIQGLAKYMEGPGLERVRYTCERYKLPGTIHVDVLSYFAIRNDWDPQHPASGIRNLVAGRYRILDEFKKHGVDVTSEGLRYPYIGKISLAWYASNPEPCPFGGQPVPMRSMIYRKSALWGRTGKRGDPANLPLAMFYGESQHGIFGGTSLEAGLVETFYLYMVPWFHLNRLNIEGFERTGDRTVTTLEGTGNRVDIDWAKNSYSVTLNGAEVARDNATFCPLGTDRLALYTLSDGPLTAVLPDGWDAAKVVAASLATSGKTAMAVTCDGRKATVDMKARTPVMIYRDKNVV